MENASLTTAFFSCKIIAKMLDINIPIHGGGRNIVTQTKSEMRGEIRFFHDKFNSSTKFLDELFPIMVHVRMSLREDMCSRQRGRVLVLCREFAVPSLPWQIKYHFARHI